LSLKEDIEIVKEGISSEEQFLTSSIKVERFVKKYKQLLVSGLAVVLVGIIGYVSYDYYDKDRLQKANSALSKLLQNPSDKESLEVLKSKSPKLYEAYAMSLAVNKNDQQALSNAALSTNTIFSDIAKYQLAALKGDENSLRIYASNKDAILKDLANFLLAQKAIEKKDTKGASEYLAKIPASSNLKEQSLYLQHLLITQNKSN
jgi:predicted negative regulator of RcsB-dependent stress response